MSQYYNKSKFTEKPRQPQKKNDNEWFWPVVIILFVTGLWPIALFLLLFFSDKKGKSSPEEKIRRAQQKIDDTIDDALRHMSGTASSDGKPRAKVVESATAPKTAPQKKEKKAKESQSSDNSLVWQIVGGALLAVASLVMVEPITELISAARLFSVEELVIGINFLLAGGIMFGRGLHLKKAARRSRRYLAAIGDADSMDIRLIARRVGRSYGQTVKDLQKMIDRNDLGDDAYLDLERGWFLRFGAEAEAVPSTPKETSPSPSDGYAGILCKIRTANDRIDDPVLSAKIDRLEQITGLILREVESHPEKRAKLATFFDYYLPTTQKLLDAYADFEETGVEGENLRTAKERIQQTMDGIVEGFAHQLDSLYHADAMDLASDIKVMETMLHRDIGSAAKDFQYDKYQEPM